jgi:Arc/MetJ-type ribon-helix-helix transcriptional regulator
MSALRPTMVQLPTDLVARADQRAAREGVSRSHVIREALTAFLVDDERERIARVYDEGYGRFPYGVEDEWGSVQAFHDALARERASSPRGRKRAR